MAGQAQVMWTRIRRLCEERSGENVGSVPVRRLESDVGGPVLLDGHGDGNIGFVGSSGMLGRKRRRIARARARERRAGRA